MLKFRKFASDPPISRNLQFSSKVLALSLYLTLLAFSSQTTFALPNEIGPCGRLITELRTFILNRTPELLVLSPPERVARRIYTGEDRGYVDKLFFGEKHGLNVTRSGFLDSTAINAFLEGRNVDADLVPALQEIVQHLDSAISKSPRIPQGRYVRGIGGRMLELKEGESITVLQYLSVSRDTNRRSEAIQTFGGASHKTGPFTVMVIDVPLGGLHGMTGRRGSAFGGSSFMGLGQGEYEYVLRRGTVLEFQGSESVHESDKMYTYYYFSAK